jgi:hypothetical protein
LRTPREPKRLNGMLYYKLINQKYRMLQYGLKVWLFWCALLASGRIFYKDM